MSQVASILKKAPPGWHTLLQIFHTQIHSIDPNYSISEYDFSTCCKIKVNATAKHKFHSQLVDAASMALQFDSLETCIECSNPGYLRPGFNNTVLCELHLQKSVK